MGIAKAEWCCKHESKGCTGPATTTSALFDCGAGGHAQVHAWSPERKDWCCRQKNIACSSTTAVGPGLAVNCHAEPETEWTADKRKWCCKHYLLGCSRPETTSVPRFDCKA